MGHVIMFHQHILGSITYKVDVSGENDASQDMFEVILLASHGCVILAVIVQIVIMIISLRAARQQEDPLHRLQRPSNSTRNIQACIVEDDTIEGKL